MNNNKGFTFVELLVVIALLSIVLILTISQIQRVNNNSKIKLCKNKLSLIEESLDLYLENNKSLFSSSGICDEEPVSGICYTSVAKIANQGIIDYDKNEKVINPVNNEDLNNYQVKIMYNSSNDKFSSEIQKKGESGESVSDKNYDTICGKSAGIKENDDDKSIFDKKSYKFKIITIEEDGSKRELDTGLKPVEKAINEIGNYCKSLSFEGIEDYSYVSYDIKDENTVNCIYKKGIRYSLNIDKDDNVILEDFNEKKKYKLNESVTIKVKFNQNYLYDENKSYCDVPESCEYNKEDSTIKVTFKAGKDIKLTIKSRYMLDVGMYYENPDEDNKYDTDASNNQLFVTDDEAKSYCEANVKENYVFEEYNSEKCYYKLKRTNLSFDLSDTNVVSVLVDPGSKSMSGTTSTITDYYKYGQKITLKVNYKNGYEYDSIVCISGECTLNDDGTITLVSYADSVSITPKAKKTPPKYMVYHHYQDADDINGYSSVLISNDDPVNETATEATVKTTYCEKVSGYTYQSTISFYNTSNNEVNCYYDRNTYTVTFVKGNASAFDSHVSKINIVPASSTLLGLTSLSNNSTAIKFRHGQEIIINKSNFATDYELDSVTCSDSNQCTIGKDGVTRVTVPTNNNLKVYVKSKPTEIEYKVYHHYQDADDINGYTAKYIKTIGVVLSVGDDNNYNAECNKTLAGFTYNKNISYLDRSKKEINCYFDRDESVTVTFDEKLKNIKSNLGNFKIELTPNNSKDVASSSVLDNIIVRKYRSGQEIVLKITGFVNVTDKDAVTCEGEKNLKCSINGNGSFKIKLDGIESVEFIPGTVTYKVYNHYQDADNPYGFTIERMEDVGISMVTSDNTNYDSICSKQSISGFSYKYALSYLISSKKEINCYFERNEFNVTFKKYDTNVDKINIVPASSVNFGLTSLTGNSTSVKFRHGQEILIGTTNFKADYELDYVECSDKNQCTIGQNGITKVIVPENGNLIVTIKSKPVTREYKLYNHYQDANNVNGYTAEVKNITVNLALGDTNNVAKICKEEANNISGYNYYSYPSYLDRSKKEVNCYFNIK